VTDKSIDFKNTPLKQPLLYGVFLRWPENGEQWVHPFDIGIARNVLPSYRVFRRAPFDEVYYQYTYGDIVCRAKARMWMVVEHEGFDVGDRVEIKSQMGRNWPMLANIREVLWNPNRRHIEYWLDRNDGTNQQFERPYIADQIQLVFDLDRVDGKIPQYQPPLNSVASFATRRQSS